MIILPIGDWEKAKELLDQAIADKYTITMLVFGDEEGMDQIAQKAGVREVALASTRRVVWIRDVSILTDDQRQSYRKGNDDIVVCTLNLDDRPVVYLTRDEADSYVALEKAFAKAQIE